MRYLIAFCLVALCGSASGQATQIGDLTLTAGSVPEPIVTCTMKDEHRVDKCTMAAGHTLEEVMQGVMDMNKLNSESFNAEMKDANKRITRCIGIAEQENKALRRCAAGLDDVGKMLRKEAGK